MEKIFTKLTLEHSSLIAGGRSKEFADFMEIIGMGFGILSKLLYKLKSAFKENITDVAIYASQSSK